MTEEKIVTGAIKSKPDSRDYIYEKLGFSTIPFDWSISSNGLDLEPKNQGNSGSCGGQAWAYFMACLDNDTEEKSAKFIYSHTHVQPAGSAGRTNCQLCKDKGVADEKLCSSYENGATPSEEFMQRESDITSEAYTNALKDRAISYVQVTDTSFDNLARVIRDNKGVVLGVYGKNNGTWLSKFPKPPVDLPQAWAHWVFANKVKMIDGKKYIGFTNSWGASVGDNGVQWIGEEYIPFFFEVWTMVYDKQEKYVFTQTLRLGSKGFEVKQLQIRLNLNSDGIFGKWTKLAVQAFQLRNHLVADGIVGKLTRSALNSK